MVAAMSTEILLMVLTTSMVLREALGIDCFECFSFNKSDPACGDPFHPAYGNYKEDCQQGKADRVGGFPARFCIKLIGNTGKDDIEMVYRGCSLTDLDSQCGSFLFEKVKYNGCISSCSQNGCNQASGLRSDLLTLCAMMAGWFVSVLGLKRALMGS